MLYSEIRHLTQQIVQDEISKALGNPELGAPNGILLEPGAQWENIHAWWTGFLALRGTRHRWTLSENVLMNWVNFGIPLPFIMSTLDNCIVGLEAECQANPDLAARVWLNYGRRLA